MNSKLIEINLSEKFKQKKQKKKPFLKIPNALGVLLIVVIVIFALTHLLLHTRENSLRKMTSKYNQLKTPAEETKKLRKMSDVLGKKHTILKDCKKGWLTWADKWLEIAKLTPDSIFLQEIKISNENKLNGKQTLLIRGRVSGKEGESVLLSYLEALKASKIFNTRFHNMVLSPVYTEGNEKVFSIDFIQ